MKKCLCVCLAVLMLLSGCGKKTGASDGQAATEPATLGLYDPSHPMEQQTVGAIRAYPLGESGHDYVDITLMGSKLLLLKEDGSAMVLQGENCEVLAEGNVGLTSFEGSNFSVGAQGLAVYEPENDQVVFHNPQLQVVDRITLPQDIQGDPVISLESNEIFYCQNGEIRALNLENNTPRLLKSHIVEEQTLTGCYFDGTVIRCEAIDAQGTKNVLYLSAENGLTLSEEPDIFTLATCGDRYFIQRLDNTVLQNIVGTQETGARSLALPTDGTVVLQEALEMNGIVSYAAVEGGLELSFHDLSKEQTTAKLLLPDTLEPVAIVADSSFVWLIIQEETQQVLYRWDVQMSTLTQTVSVIAPLYTAQSPDVQGLEACQKTAEQLETNYGVKLHIWQDAVARSEEDTAVVEHQPLVIQSMLAQLEPALQRFPESFLRKTVRSGWIRIGLVRSLENGRAWTQFWSDGDCYILISSKADVAQAFLEAVGYGIDSCVLGNSRDFDTWTSLNPEGFTYGMQDYDPSILEGETRAFVNGDALVSPIEDRRLMFAAAITEGNGELFTSQIMQSKLRRLCEGIREAYGLEKKKEIYIWEQYLNEPLVEIGQTNG